MNEIINNLTNKGVSEAELFFSDTTKENITFENGTLKSADTSQNAGIAIRAVKDNNVAFVTSSNLEDAEKIAENAIEVSKFSPKKDFEFAYNKEKIHETIGSAEIFNIPMEKLIEEGNKAVSIIKKYDSNIQVDINFNKEKRCTHLINTKGTDVEYEKNSFNAMVIGSLIEGTSFINCISLEKNNSGSMDIEKLSYDVIKNIEISKKDCAFLPGKKEVILTPSALCEILLTLQRGVNGAIVEKGISPLKGKIGEKIFDDKISIYDDATLEDGDATMSFDDEGTPARKTTIIKNGFLNSYIHSLRTASKLGQEPTGNGLRTDALFPFRKYDAPPAPNITNWVMDKGNIPYEDMVSNIKDGVIIKSIMGILMNNLENGDFAGNIGMGYVIKNGKIAGRLKDAAINANIYDIFLKNIVDLSSSLYKASAFDYLGSHLMPYVLLKDINISAKK